MNQTKRTELAIIALRAHLDALTRTLKELELAAFPLDPQPLRDRR